MWSENPTLHVNAFLNFFRKYFHLANELVHVTVPGKTAFSDTLLAAGLNFGVHFSHQRTSLGCHLPKAQRVLPRDWPQSN